MIERTDPETGSTRPVRVAAVMAERHATGFAGHVELRKLAAHDWREAVEGSRPDLLLIQSDDDGRSDVSAVPLGSALRDVVAWFRDRHIPTAYWSMVGGARAGREVWAAAHFDHVFTVDLDTVTMFRSALGHDQVHLLPVGVDPAVHNPLDRSAFRIDAAVLCATFDAREPGLEERLRRLLGACAQHLPVLIHDTGPRTKGGPSSFPERLWPFLVDHHAGSSVADIVKRHAIGLHLGRRAESQTFVDGEVLELLASGVPAVGAHAHAVRLMFGDSTVSSGDDAVLRRAIDNAVHGRSKRPSLLGLRTVLAEHTMEHRVRELLAVTLGLDRTVPLPDVHVVTSASNQDELDRVASAVRRQLHQPTSVTVVAPRELHERAQAAMPHVLVRTATQDSEDAVTGSGYVAVFDPRDHHGSAFLLDLVLALRFSRGHPVGKQAHFTYVPTADVVELEQAQARYRTGARFPMRAALVPVAVIEDRTVQQVMSTSDHPVPADSRPIATDEFNYCRDVPDADLAAVSDLVDDLPDPPRQVPLSRFAFAARGGPDRADTAPRGFRSVDLAAWFDTTNDQRIEFAADHGAVRLTARVGDHTTVWSATPVPVEQLAMKPGWVSVSMPVQPTGLVELVLEFFADDGERLDTAVVGGNQAVAVKVPHRAATLLPGMRVYAGGAAVVGPLRVGGEPEVGPVVLAGRHLLITNRYPAYNAPYNNMFVHKRVKGYNDRGQATDVVQLTEGAPFSVREFQDIECISGGKAVLQSALRTQEHDSIAVHFLTPPVWDVIRDLPDERRICVWIHGFEIQPWWRRSFNYRSAEEEEEARRATTERMETWREVFSDDRPNLHFAFVSDYLARQAMEDTGIELDPSRYSVVHNPVDTDLFAHHQKTAEHRFKVLSIRPFASRTYANDLTVRAILELRDEPWFEQLDVRILGQGPLWHETVEPLRDLPNVTLEPSLVQHEEIARLHREYGIFLCPSRMDSHGVSRDEAMSSGLVPVTSDVAAIPEFVDASCGFLAPPEDHMALAGAIRQLVADPALFLRLSRAAAQRVRQQADHRLVIERELEILRGNTAG